MKNRNKASRQCITPTTNYGMFKTVKGNRIVKLDSSASKKLLLSIIETKGNIMPILVNSNMEVLDGQHRLAACKLAKMPVTYIVAPDSLIIDSSQDTMITLNDASNSWKIRDYFRKHHIADGKKPYGQLLALDLKTSVGIEAIINLSTYSKGRLRDGANIVLPQDLKKNIKYCEDYKRIYDKNSDTTTNLRPQAISNGMKKIKKTFKSFDHATALRNLDKSLIGNVGEKQLDVANMMIVALNQSLEIANKLPKFI